ncbi:nuclease-related domain-containing protein [Domibacillus iocasae]|uniref:NERD domain-containing protein n=1 Tax=Domibacillus iocasae TaxID=1714016 RepID=A0A1E7DRN6_9BACI|nr:nuclease-related domain-containing protein [Domibacillus iocasae]OES45742.1 hypothetical protein BA724_02755 [Domibacillus iocasae]
MFIKYCEKPSSILQTEILLERISPHHKAIPALKKQLHQEQAGYQGKKQVDFYLRELPHRHFLFLHDLRLKTEMGTFFQIDTLVLTGKTAIILEVKNYADSLH